MRAVVFWVPLLFAVSAAALAQPAGNTVLTPLPSPPASPSDRPSDYLRAAQGALAAGLLGGVCRGGGLRRRDGAGDFIGVQYPAVGLHEAQPQP